MRRTLAIIATTVVGLLLTAALLPTPTSAQDSVPAALYKVYVPQVVAPPNASAPADQATIAEVLTLVNAERAKAGCPALTLNTRLSAAAQAHSEDMALRNYFSHTSPDGTSASQRVTDAGYDWRMTAENIAAGQTSASAVMAAWMGSTGHRANILNCGYAEIGIGHVFESGDTFPSTPGYGHYWTQNFGTPW